MMANVQQESTVNHISTSAVPSYDELHVNHLDKHQWLSADERD